MQNPDPRAVGGIAKMPTVSLVEKAELAVAAVLGLIAAASHIQGGLLTFHSGGDMNYHHPYQDSAFCMRVGGIPKHGTHAG